jgi:hypothetical protein
MEKSRFGVALGFALVIAVNLAAQLAVTLAMHNYWPGNLPTSYQVLNQISYPLYATQFATALFCLTYSRFPAPWRILGCTAWVATAAIVYELCPGKRQTSLTWNALFAVTSLWSGYALLVLGRWHFATEFAPGKTQATPRSWIFSPSALMRLIVIITFAAMCNLLFHFVDRPANFDLSIPIGSAAVGSALLNALLFFPLLVAMLTTRFTWYLVAALAACYLVAMSVRIVPIALENPPFGLELTVVGLLSVLPLTFNAFVFRWLGLRWQESLPWPISAQKSAQAVVNPFE